MRTGVRHKATMLIVLTILLLVPVLEIETAHAANEIPITGIPVPGMESFDRIVTDLMAKWQIPGGQVAVTKDGRLVFAHGYGQADVDLKQPVQPDSLFRIASISKPITAVAVLKLAEEGRLDLDAKAFRILDHLKPPTGASVDPRMWDITIRELLQHSGGWDRTKSFDPMFISTEAAQAVGVAPPASCETIIRYMLGQRLDFDPGTKYAYSNFGYCVLGRIIEKVTAQKYEDYVRANLLGPIGIADMRIGHTQLKDRAENEVHYYDYLGAPLVQSVFPDVTSAVPAPYGDFYLEAMDSHGGWIASAADLVRFAVSIDGERQPAFLTPESVQIMTSRPAPPLWVGEDYWYGMGWMIRPIEGTSANWWHAGSLPGTRTLLVRTYHGLSWAALFNTRPPPDVDSEIERELDDSLWQAANAVTAWPTNDLFATPTTTTSGKPVELAYDDGDAETGWFKKSAGLGGYDAVRFSPPFESSQILTAKYYIRSSPASFSVLILDANRRSIYDKPATPTTEGWFEVDLSKENIVVDGEFYAAMKWVVPEKPSLGADETKPDGRSFFVDADGTWQTYAEVNKAVTKSNKDGDFMIRATVDRPKAKITLQVEPKIAGVTVDGVSYSADRLPVTSTWEIGSAHTLSVDSTISGEEGVRYVFVEWSDGSKDTSHTITVTETASLTARFKTQYELNVVSDLGDPQGSGWHDAGSTATFSVTSPQPGTGLFGSLGGKRVFQAWIGDAAADTATASITMDGPKTVQAEWTTDDSQPYMILGGIGAAIVVAIVVFLFIRRRGAAPPPPPIIPTRLAVPPPQAAAPQPPFCVNYGSPMTYIQEHQRYYCYNCQEYA
jgi:N-acyl-D-amino-acid deacylase